MSTRKEQMEAFGRFLDILDDYARNVPGIANRRTKACAPIPLKKTYELCDALSVMTKVISVKSWVMCYFTWLSMPRSARKRVISI